MVPYHHNVLFNQKNVCLKVAASTRLSFIRTPSVGFDDFIRPLPKAHLILSVKSQFDSVRAWKQIKSCCFSQWCWDTQPVGTGLTRGPFAVCVFVCDKARNSGASLDPTFSFPFSALGQCKSSVMKVLCGGFLILVRDI